MLNRIFRFLVKMIIALIAIALIALIFPRVTASLVTIRQMTTVPDAEAAPVAIVLGAGLQLDGSPSVILRDRLDTAIQLYQAGKVQKLLMSGDNPSIYYNEPGSMQEYAIGKQVPAEDIVLDYAGRRTYDTCYRALHIFKVEKAILVTQRFHLVRALFTCRQLGLEATGIPSDPRPYNSFWLAREYPATSVAFWELFVTHPLPVLGEIEPVLPETTLK